jgi:hypothetical protein
VKHQNVDVGDHQQAIALAGTPSQKRIIKKRKLSMKQKKPTSKTTWAVKKFHRS